jgi:hypothetical protein
MSDIYNGRMIPLHIADKAIINCNKEIEKLQIDNARLKAEVERLTKAGDAMLSEWASGEEKDAKNFRKALVIWNAAKEGKQP